LVSIKNKWLFNRAVLKAGDILFTRSPVIGTGIAKVTKGRFGHVMLYLENTIIHADMKGVWSKNPQRILMNDSSRLSAFRLKEPLSLAHLTRIESFARARVGSIYSVPQAIQSLKKRPEEIAERCELHTQFCSRLVAQSFAEVGINLVSDFDFCTPTELSESPLLYELPDAVVQAGIYDIEFSKTRDYNAKIQTETYRWLSKVRALTIKHGLRPINSQNDVGQLVLDNPHLDSEICSYILETQYLDLYDSDERKIPWRYDPDLLLAVIASNPSGLSILAEERRLNTATGLRVSSERVKAVHNARSGLGYFLLEEKLQTMRLIHTVKWRDAINFVEKKIGANTASK
jgi:hypothetical protein